MMRTVVAHRRVATRRRSRNPRRHARSFGWGFGDRHVHHRQVRWRAGGDGGPV